MKMLKKLRNHLRKSLTNNRGQGATEYILLVVVVVGLVIAFKKPILDKFNSKVGELTNKMDEATN